MALTASISNNELARVAAAAYEGKRIRVSLAAVGTSGFTKESTRTSWDSVKLSGNGYADYTEVVATGVYDNTDGRLEMGGEDNDPYIQATFTADGGTLTYDRIYVVIGTDDGDDGWDEENTLHSLLIESPAITLASGMTSTYRLQLFVND
jgi:hypothetical protein